MPIENQPRVVWAFVGEYASGKSENAVNAALALKAAGRQVTLVDLDVVEPCYTLRPLKEELSALGLEVVAWATSETFGLGEAGQTLLPMARWALRRQGDVIFDVGYGVYGSQSLNLVEGALTSAELKIILVLNTSRPMTANPELMEEYILEMGRVDGIIANTHMMDETTPQLIEQGYEMIGSVCQKLNIPLLYVAVSRDFMKQYPDFSLQDHRFKTTASQPEVRVMERFMPRSFW